MSRYSAIGLQFTSFLANTLGKPLEQAKKASLAFQSECGQRELPVKSIKLGSMKEHKESGQRVFARYSEKLEILKNEQVTPALELYKAMQVLQELPEGFVTTKLIISDEAEFWLAKFEVKTEEKK